MRGPVCGVPSHLILINKGPSTLVHNAVETIMENHTMRVLQSLVISVCLGLTIHGAYAQKSAPICWPSSKASLASRIQRQRRAAILNYSVPLYQESNHDPFASLV